MSRWVLAIGLLTIVIGVGGAGYGVWSIWNQHRLFTSARPVVARVLDHRSKDLKASGFVAKVPLVKYEYTVNQQRYTCEMVTPSELMLPDTWAEHVFDQFPIGAQTEAKYDPSDPSNAFLVAKYSVKPYLPLLVSLVISALGVGVVGEQLMNHDSPRMTTASSGALAVGAKQHHLSHARVLGVIGILGLICGAPAILHHLMVSTSPHERMGFLLEGAYGIAVITVVVRSVMGFRQGYGFGTPVVTLERPPTIGQSVSLNVVVPTQFNGTVHLNVCLKCEAKDTRLFNFSEETPNTVLLAQNIQLLESEPVSKGDEVTRTVDLIIPDHVPPSTPIASGAAIQIVWSLILTTAGSGGRKAVTEYILSVNNAPSSPEMC
ncbi:MAG: DUF3592 domain-containing protein [Planctomycetaceae bacterium]|nr:DUF3592 domain-containing protein [Planctomycetales bacterium]MCB9927170.1 DUF3592 domain-containing protein [Planctomycetaceae bacterium]